MYMDTSKVVADLQAILASEETSTESFVAAINSAINDLSALASAPVDNTPAAPVTVSTVTVSLSDGSSVSLAPTA